MEYEFRFHDVGEGIQEGTILEWKIQTGGKVSEGQIIVVVETDKVVAELPSPRDGTLLRRRCGPRRWPGDWRPTLGLIWIG